MAEARKRSRKPATGRKAAAAKSPARRPRRTAAAGRSGKTSAAKKSENKSAGKTAKKTAKKTANKTTRKTAKPSARRWSQRVTEHSDALDLRRGVFTLRDPGKIAASLKRSAEASARRKTGAYRSALSMLTFYINRAGKNLPKTQRDRLQRAKHELKRQFGREG